MVTSPPDAGPIAAEADLANSPLGGRPELAGQTVAVIGGSAGIGFATAQRARAAGADVIVTGRDSERLAAAAADLEAVDSAAFDATDADALDRFFGSLPPTVHHIMLSAGEFVNALNGEAVGANSINLCAHFDKAMREV